jgi:glutamate N-acetyltransferase/amino-acid N-acetyltransferase
MSTLNWIEGGITAPAGYKAAGVHAGIKAAKMDMALIVSDVPACVAATFTTNKIQGAHVKVCKQRIPRGLARAIIVNSGSANACTGPQGIANAEQTAQLLASALSINELDVLMCSTGTIGKPLPMDKIAHGIQLAAAALSPTGGRDAATAIMTTDTVAKEESVEIKVDGKAVRLGGIAKGAGMIEPKMATMLSFVTTDAAVDTAALQRALSAAVEQSFNRISVDGDQSCNDTVFLLANGRAGNRVLNEAHPDWKLFTEALNAVTRNLAFKIVKDGEGATKFVSVTVSNAASNADATKAARAIANSLLVKTSWFGCDPNWGRIIDAAGYSGAEVQEEKVDIRFDHIFVVRGGQIAPDASLKDLEKIYQQKTFEVHIDLHLGAGTDTVYTCDCSVEYVKINADYMT